ncbi:uncharacterized protein N7482_008069 [Penicillium canariense]|uniref:Uncharacterized protein n=1 Tax=Penicillium canariense TaxID=189055 RepID=A0A9W9HV35_9EURO|nr:uncharacterized protein N7482_008069 [Penicillium canariense]KAJ5156969.1 hypothetical protein N7482_008069 [Penicillium canariense]
MPLPQALRGSLSEQFAAVRPLADSLYDSIGREPTLINQARDELDLLRVVLDVTETSSALLCVDNPPALGRTLESCRLALVELEKVHHRDEVRSLSPLSDIRARFSSLIFELSVMNADMMISSQKNVNRLLRGYIEDVRAGKRESAIVSNVLDDAFPKNKKDEAWKRLQQELHDVGIVPEWSDQDHGYIISTLRTAVGEQLLQRSVTKPVPPKIPPQPTKPQFSPSNSQPYAILIAEPFTLPHQPPEHQERGLSDKEVLPMEDFPIPVAMELQDVADTEKHVLLRDNVPVPIAREPFCPENGASDRQVLAQEIFPIPVDSEPSIENSLVNRSENSSSVSGSYLPKSMIRSKKPSLVRRMKFRLTSSKEEFVSLIQIGGLYPVKLALDKGADANTTNDEGQSALMVAVSFGHHDISQLLLEYGASIDKVSHKGDSALGTAALIGREDIARMLLVYGADPNAGKNRGKTALSQAAAAGYEHITRLLLDRGADPDGLCTSGDTALARAAFYGHIDTARLLLRNGALVDKTAYPRQTPLWRAVHQGQTEMVRLLMTFRADPTTKDVHGQSPLSLAASLGRSEILRIFRQYGYQTSPLQYY